MEEYKNTKEIDPITKKIIGKVAVAFNNPMLETDFLKLKDELSSLLEQMETEETQKRKAEVLWKIMRSSVITDNITEYRETLLFIARKCGFELSWANNTFQNETSHANEMEKNDGNDLEILTVFVKDEKDKILKPEPFIVRKSDIELAKNS